MNSCEEFLELIVKSHVIAGVLQELSVQDLESAFKTVAQSDLHSCLDSTLEAIETKYVNLSFPSMSSTPRADHVLEYAKTLSLGLLIMEFKAKT